MSEPFNCRCLNIFAAETSRAQLAPTRRDLRLKSKIIGELNASDTHVAPLGLKKSSDKIVAAQPTINTTRQTANTSARGYLPIKAQAQQHLQETVRME